MRRSSSLGCDRFSNSKMAKAEAIAEQIAYIQLTMWANLSHSLLMEMQVFMSIDCYWSKWFTDIPFVLILAFGIFFGYPGERLRITPTSNHE